MKKIVFALSLLITSICFGQDEKFTIRKGTWSLEGSIFVNTFNEERFDDSNQTRDNTSFSLSPYIGYAIKDNLILGIGFRYSYGKTEDRITIFQDNINTIRKNHYYEFMPYMKKFFPVSNQFAFHLLGETGFGFSRNEIENRDNTFEQKAESTQFFIGVRPGINYKLSDWFLLQANLGFLGYNSINSQIDGSDSSKSRSFTFNLSSNISFGINILF